jgi:hypothetical protein
MGEAAPLQYRRVHELTAAGPYRRPAAGLAPRARVRSGVSIEWAVIGLTAAAIVMLGTVSPELLTALKVHYISAGGAFFEKLHPATYLTILAFALLLFRGGDAVGEFDRVISGAKPLLAYFFTCALLAFQCVVLKRPFTSVIDTFLLPALLCLIIWNLTPAQRRPLIIAIHFVIWLNIALGFYEYFSKHRLIQITIGNLLVTGEWRSTALLGHPLAAAGILAMYIMAMVLRPRTRPLPILVLPALLVAACSLMVFGGRTALVAVLVVFAGIAIASIARLVGGKRFGLAAVIVTTCCIMVAGAAISIAFGTGLFDNMLSRFSSDNGSAHARIASLHLLSLFDWKELMLGTSAARAGSLQSMMGLDFGIENFWISCIVQYGIIQTTLITIGLGCFFAELLRRCAPGARVGVLFLCITAASSVSFSSKNITLALYVTIIALLLPRVRAKEAVQARPPYRAGVRYAFAPAHPVR